MIEIDSLDGWFENLLALVGSHEFDKGQLTSILVEICSSLVQSKLSSADDRKQLLV